MLIPSAAFNWLCGPAAWVPGIGKWRVSEAAEGALALAELESATHNLMLLDVLMPEMEGFELLGFCAKQRSGGTLMVVITAKDLTHEDPGTG